MPCWNLCWLLAAFGIVMNCLQTLRFGGHATLVDLLHCKVCRQGGHRSSAHCKTKVTTLQVYIAWFSRSVCLSCLSEKEIHISSHAAILVQQDEGELILQSWPRWVSYTWDFRLRTHDQKWNWTYPKYVSIKYIMHKVLTFINAVLEGATGTATNI